MAKRKSPRVFAMRADGSEEPIDATQLRFDFGDNLRLLITWREREGGVLSLYAPGDEKSWGQLVLHPNAANAVDVELRVRKTSQKRRHSPR